MSEKTILSTKPELADYRTKTYSLKTNKDGEFAWIYDDGSERFPGIRFQTQQQAIDYFNVQYRGYMIETKITRAEHACRNF